MCVKGSDRLSIGLLYGSCTRKNCKEGLLRILPSSFCVFHTYFSIHVGGGEIPKNKKQQITAKGRE